MIMGKSENAENNMTLLLKFTVVLWVIYGSVSSGLIISFLSL